VPWRRFVFSQHSQIVTIIIRYTNIVLQTSSVAAGFSRHGMPPPASNTDLWPFDLETGMRVASRWGTFFPNLGMLDLWVLQLFAMYATDRQTDGRTKAMLIAPFPTGRGIITDEPLSRLDVVSRDRETLISMKHTQNITTEHKTWTRDTTQSTVLTTSRGHTGRRGSPRQCKGKKQRWVYLYSALFVVPHSQEAQAWITQCYLQLHQCLPLPRKRSPDGASQDWGFGHLIASNLIYLPRKNERLSRPGWLTYSGRFTHISGHTLAAGRAQDRKSSPVKDRRSTTVPRNQPL